LQTFNALGLRPEILKALDEIGFLNPTEIQAKAIPALLESKPDFIGLAQTGTGKTAAFGLPILHHISTQNQHISSLIIAPTRELAQQIEKEMINFGKFIKGLRTTVVYGGTPIGSQIKELKRQAPHILVATPGRLQDLIDRKAVKLDQIEFMVLDEADEMLNMGFQEDIDNILKYTPEDKVLWLFSATMPPEIRRIITTYMESPLEVKIHSETKTNENIDHKYIYVNKSDKEAALKRVLDYLTDFYGVVFCKTKMDCQALAEFMEREGYRSDPLHGDMSQAQRDAVMARFRNKITSILIATDVAARGIDVDSLTHVVHYSLPENPEYYTHRSGRTARAGKKGTSLAIVTPEDIRRIKFFERTIGITINHIKVPLQSQMYIRKLDKWMDKVLNTETAEVSYEMVEKTESFFTHLSKKDLIEKMIALEFNRLYKKHEKDDLNLTLERKGDRYANETRGRDRDNGRNRKDGRERDRSPKSNGFRKLNPHMDTFFINIGKIDNIHPGVLVDILASHAGIHKKQVGDIDIQKRHCLVEIDKKASKNLEKSKLLKYRGRKITIKREQ
jgi:ATP-dependent RNA helicase DeaD